MKALLVILVSAWFVGVFIADEAAGQPAPGELETLLTKLTSADYAAREQASQRLVELGEIARSFLTEARKNLGIEGRLRVNAILARLSEETIRATGTLTATRIHLKASEVPVAEVAASLGEAIGVRISYGQRPGTPARTPAPTPAGSGVPINFVADDIPFFKALDLLCNTAGATFHVDYATGNFILNPTAQALGPVRYAGPLRVAATSLAVTRSTRFTGPPVSHANLQIRIDVEPGAPVIGFLSPIEGASARDDRGNPITFRRFQNQQRFLQNLGRNRQLHQSLNMEPPIPEARKLTDVAVPLDIVTPAELLTAELLSIRVSGADDPGAGSLRLKVDALTQGDNHQLLTLSFEAPAVSGPSNLRNVPQYEEIDVLDVKGQTVAYPKNLSQRITNGRQIRVLRLPDVPIGHIKVRALARYRVLRQIIRFQELELP